ncbi:MAG: hypothetical protein HY368_02945 [Candidatus Aenigmarchaeota archaeon]|nr:hypothetical protein [Candidatus Aenigmarchaeota archaeon]
MANHQKNRHHEPTAKELHEIANFILFSDGPKVLDRISDVGKPLASDDLTAYDFLNHRSRFYHSVRPDSASLTRGDIRDINIYVSDEGPTVLLDPASERDGIIVNRRLLEMVHRNLRVDFHGMPITAFDAARQDIMHDVAHVVMLYYSRSENVLDDRSKHSFADEGIPEVVSLEILYDENKRGLVIALLTDYVKTALKAGYNVDADYIFSFTTPKERERKFGIWDILKEPRMFITGVLNIPLSYGVAIGALEMLKFRYADISFKERKIPWSTLVMHPPLNTELTKERGLRSYESRLNNHPVPLTLNP